MKIKKNQYLLFVLFFIIFCVSGCDNQYALDTYGEEKAYFTNDVGIILTLDNPEGISFYLDFNTTTYSSYYLAAIHATQKSSEIEGINISINSSSTPANAKFLFRVETPIPPPSGGGCSGLGCSIDVINLSGMAENTITYTSIDPYNPKIIGSRVVFNRAEMDSISLNGKKHVALHELGHTLGLKDLYNLEVKGHTVMYGYYSFSHIKTNYTDGDVYNLEWHYKYGNCN